MSRRNVTAYSVEAGTFTRLFGAEHHAEQFARALRMHAPLQGTPVTVQAVRLPDDALTRIILGTDR